MSFDQFPHRLVDLGDKLVSWRHSTILFLDQHISINATLLRSLSRFQIPLFFKNLYPLFTSLSWHPISPFTWFSSNIFTPFCFVFSFFLFHYPSLSSIAFSMWVLAPYSFFFENIPLFIFSTCYWLMETRFHYVWLHNKNIVSIYETETSFCQIDHTWKK